MAAASSSSTKAPAACPISAKSSVTGDGTLINLAQWNLDTLKMLFLNLYQEMMDAEPNETARKQLAEEAKDADMEFYADCLTYYFPTVYVYAPEREGAILSAAAAVAALAAPGTPPPPLERVPQDEVPAVKTGQVPAPLPGCSTAPPAPIVRAVAVKSVQVPAVCSTAPAPPPCGVKTARSGGGGAAARSGGGEAAARSGGGEAAALGGGVKTARNDSGKRKRRICTHVPGERRSKHPMVLRSHTRNLSKTAM